MYRVTLKSQNTRNRKENNRKIGQEILLLQTTHQRQGTFSKQARHIWLSYSF